MTSPSPPASMPSIPLNFRPRVSGHITEVRFGAGQLVHQGDVLFVIDRRWYKADDDRTRAEVGTSYRDSWQTRNGSVTGPMSCCGSIRSHKKKPTVADRSWMKRLQP